MGLSRKMLKGMGLTEEQIDTIVEAHSDTVSGLKDQLAAAEEKAKTVDDLQKKLDDLSGVAGYKEKYEKEHSAFESFKSEVSAEKTKTAKEKASRAYFEGKNITGSNLAIAMRGAKDEVSGLELDENGNIKDTKALDALVGGEFAGLVVKTESRGAKTANPPGSNSGSTVKTKKEIMEIKDTSERQAAWAEYLEAQNAQKG